MVRRYNRLYITQQALTKAHKVGLRRSIDRSLSSLLKYMIKYSTAASKQYHDVGARRYGAFKLIVRDNALVDISVNGPNWCRDCFGVRMHRAPDGNVIDCQSCT